MKVKFLLAACAGMALASCSQEEDFASLDVAAKSNVTVTPIMDNLLSRAEIGGSNGSKVVFTADDLVSMYHATVIGDGTNATVENQFYLKNNAIYKGTEQLSTDNNASNLLFTTESMVLAGNAILVYPADTTMNWLDGDAYVTIPAEQDVNTKLYQPYVSDVFEIGAYIEDYTGISGNNDNTAGYGRNYQAPMKKVGSILNLSMDVEGEETINALGVGDVVITSVVLSDDNADPTNTADLANKSFNTKVGLKQGTNNSTLLTVDDELYAHMGKQTEVDFAVAEGSNTLTTEDVSNNKAVFTLLPHNTSISTITDAAFIKVNTNYGSVKVVNDATVGDNQKKPVTRKFEGQTIKMTVKEALKHVLENTWIANENSTFFNTAKTGGVFNRTLSIDLAELNMDGTVIKTSTQLCDLLKVRAALDMENSAELIIDADDDEFLLTADAISALTESEGITLDLNGNSFVINGGTSLNALNTMAEHITLNSIPLILTGTWSLDQLADFSNVASLEVRGQLTVTNTTSAGKSVTTPTPADTYFGSVLTEIVVAEDATLVVSGKVYMGALTAEEGSTITVADGNTYYAAAETNLFGTVNVAKLGYFSACDATGATNNFGTINNNGKVTVVEAQDGKFYNGGIINNLGNFCLTYITENEAITDAVTYTGAIVMNKITDEIKVYNSLKQGYIKYSLDAVGEDFAVVEDDVLQANYLTINVKEDIANIDITEMGTGVKYLELIGGEANIVNGEDGVASLTDLIINTASYTSRNINLAVTNLWVKEALIHAGNINATKINSNGTDNKYNSGIYGAEDVEFNGESQTSGTN